jgi:hypothetical protein
MRISFLTILLALPAVLAGCGAIQSYPLVPPTTGPQSTFPGLVACAARQHYQTAQHSDSVNVQVDPGVWVQFMDQPTGFNMVVLVTEKSPDADARAKAAKAKGNDLYACALRPPGAV